MRELSVNSAATLRQGSSANHGVPARHEWVSAVVPFASGQMATDALAEPHVVDCATEWQPFGARWPDGSVHTLIAAPPRIG